MQNIETEDIQEPIPEPEVLVVDDDENVADMHTHRLMDEFDVLTTTSGQQALDAISTNTDIVLLDRRMPNMDGDDVLKEIRSAGYNVQVIMVTAIDPTLEISEMDFDDYLTKPVGHDTLIETTKQQIKLKRYKVITNKIFTLENKIEVLEEEQSKIAVNNNEEYNKMQDELTFLRNRKESMENDQGEINI